MIKAVTFLLVSLVGITSFAQTSPPPQTFQDLTKVIVETGSPTETFGGLYLTLSERSQLPEQGAHQADYISTVGRYNADRKYEFGRVEIVSEQWRPTKQGRWDIDQWVFTASPDGEVIYARRVHIVETANGTILIHETVPTLPEEEQLQWNLQLQNWYKRLSGAN